MREFGPIILLASERSGTNLLRAIMSSHSQIASPPPSGMVDALANNAYRYLSPLHGAHLSELIDDSIKLSESHLNSWDIGLDRELVFGYMKGRSFWDVFKAMNDAYAAHKECIYWFSKEPGVFRHIYEIILHMPNAKFIYMVRDGRDVAASMIKGGLHATDIYSAANIWKRDQAYCLSAISDPVIAERCLLIKYEDLILQSKESVVEIMDFLQVEFEEGQLSFYENKDIVQHSEKSDFWKNTAKPIDSSNSGSYKRKLSENQISVFESVAWNEMKALGYGLEAEERPRLSLLKRGGYKVKSILKEKWRRFNKSEESKKHSKREKAVLEVLSRNFEG